MKVFIGKYKSRIICTIFDRYMKKKYGTNYPKYKNYTKFDHFISNLDDFIQYLYNKTINKIIDESKRKIQVKIHDYDVWNMDSTLATIIIPMLKLLKEDKCGAPFVDYFDVPEQLHPTSEEIDEFNTSGLTDSKYFERWDYVLNEMIFAFESKFNDWEDQFSSGELDHIFVPVDKEGNIVQDSEADFFRMENGPNHTYKFDYEGRDAYQKRITNGFRLFGKYYESLWS